MTNCCQLIQRFFNFWILWGELFNFNFKICNFLRYLINYNTFKVGISLIFEINNPLCAQLITCLLPSEPHLLYIDLKICFNYLDLSEQFTEYGTRTGLLGVQITVKRILKCMDFRCLTVKHNLWKGGQLRDHMGIRNQQSKYMIRWIHYLYIFNKPNLLSILLKLYQLHTVIVLPTLL